MAVDDAFDRIRAFQQRVQSAMPPDMGGYQGQLQSVRNAYYQRLEAERQAAQQRMFKQPQRVGSARGYTGGYSSPSNTPKGAIQAYVADFARRRYGWSGAEWNALNDLITRESGWQHTVKNPTSSAFGLFQFLKSTAANYGIPYRTSNYKQQTDAGLRYIKDRYGTPSAALAFWLSRKPINGRDVGHWY